MPKKKNKRKNTAAAFEQGAFVFIRRIGSVGSIIIHTLFFLFVFVLGLIGYDWNTLLLVLTTVVSLEAIYLAIFIQMTVNQNTQSLSVVEENIDEIQEDIDEIQEDIDDIQEDVDEIQEDVDDIAEDDKEGDNLEQQQTLTLQRIQDELSQLAKTIAALNKNVKR